MNENHEGGLLPKGFLSDVMTAAGLVSYGKQCKELGERLSVAVMAIRAAAPQPPASVQPLAVGVEADLNWREVAVWWEQGAKDWQDLKEIIPRMFNRAALPPPGRGMVPMSEGEIVEFAKQIPWLGFRKDEDGDYTIPVIGPSEMKLIRMVEARALGIPATGSGALGDGGSGE